MTACSRNFGKLIFFKLSDIVSFPTKKVAIFYLVCKQVEKTMRMLLFVSWNVVSTFLISQRFFFLSLSQTTQILCMPVWYQNCHMFEKVGGMRLWIRTSTFKVANKLGNVIGLQCLLLQCIFWTWDILPI